MYHSFLIHSSALLQCPVWTVYLRRYRYHNHHHHHCHHNINIRPENEEFNGAEMTAVFGGVECDLRNAVIEKDCVIEATAIFGGIDVFLPKNVNVKINSNSLFGGVSGKNRQNSEENTVTVYINGTAVFGGVEIK